MQFDEKTLLKDYDFVGWATKNNLKCADGRIIRENAFKHNDGQIVPLVWMHNHNDPTKVLGHVLLKNTPEGVRSYGKFNNTDAGLTAKELVHNGDVNKMSIYANQLKQRADEDAISVYHGDIKEVSLVLAGANPGATIESEIVHGQFSDESGYLCTGDYLELKHSEESNDSEEKKETKKMEENTKKVDTETKEEKSETIEDIFNTLTDKQKNAVYALVGSIMEEDDEDDDTEETEGGKEMKHNVFETEETISENVLSHSDMEAILKDGKKYGSLRDSFLAHTDGEEVTLAYGIDNIDYLFPDARAVDSGAPRFIQRDTNWVNKILNGAHHTPFSRIKSTFANITEDEARAKGYIKGKMKKEEVFSLLKRTTDPQTVYKKQKLDRDDIIDITDFDVVAWLKGEMRFMLDEEIARAALIGDGRLSSDDDKIHEDHIRPIWTDADLFTIKAAIEVTGSTTPEEKAKAFITTAIRSRKNYKGSGNPSLYTTEDMLTEMLLITDDIGRDIYDSVEKLCKKLRVKEIITVPVMEGASREAGGKTYDLGGIITNMNDYNFGADKGGSVNMFDDFDIDYNQQKYLIETRCSGALTVPYSAIAIEFKS